MRPLVSIVIPCFNAERTIAEAIQSGLDQTYEHREIIVIDDGSTDRSLEIIQSFGNQIRWETGPNRGGNHARNRGIELSHGDFIQFLDADDFLYPKKIEAMMEEASQADARTIIASSWDLQRVGSPDFNAHKFKLDCTDAFGWCLNNDLQTSAPFHRKDMLIDFGGFDPQLRCCQEYDLHLRLFSKGVKLKLIEMPLYRFRRQHNSVSSDLTKILIGKRRVLEKLAGSMEDDFCSSVRLRQIAIRIATDARLLCQQREWSECQASFATARKMDPAAIGYAFRKSSVALVAHVIGPVAAERMLFTLKSLIARR